LTITQAYPAPVETVVAKQEFFATTVFERWMLFLGIVLMPLQDHIPPVAGLSVMFIVFAIMALYVVFIRSKFLVRAIIHPVFQTLYLLLAIATLMEFVHVDSDLFEIRRMLLMVFGALVVATLCRDQKALRVGIYSYLVSGFLVALNMLFAGYEPLSLARMSTLAEAGAIQRMVAQEDLIRMNLNKMALVIAQGAVVALVLGLARRGRLWLLLFAVISAIGVTLTMSRGGLVILTLTTLYILTLKGQMKWRTTTVFIISLLALSFLVPESALKRIELTNWNFLNDPRPSGRARTYLAAVVHFREYALYGVGFGNFWGKWGLSSWFRKGVSVHGTHSYFISVWVYWGLFAELVLFWTLIRLRKLLPRGEDVESLKLCLKVIAVSTFLFLFFNNVLSDKSYSLILGLLIGSNIWIYKPSEYLSKGKR
jgi:hypothetical protein